MSSVKIFHVDVSFMCMSVSLLLVECFVTCEPWRKVFVTVNYKCFLIGLKSFVHVES